jgi:outer membrane lipoprotein carrier protein
MSWFFLIPLLLGGQSASAGPPKGYNKAFDILTAAKIQAYYAKIKDFKAAFTHIYYKRYHGKQKPRYGYLWVKKPGKMYWRYDAPQKRHFICDGKRIWIYTPGDKQVLWRKVARSQLPSAVKFLWGSGQILKEFYIKILHNSKYGGKGKTVLRLQPIKPTSHYTHILFVIEPAGKTAKVTETLVYDSLGNKNHYIFRKPKLNTGIQSTRFNFAPPKGVRVIHATRKKGVRH